MIYDFFSESSNVYKWRWVWYFQIVFKEFQHWTFPKHNYKRVVTLSVIILDNSQQEMILYHFCAIYAATYTIRLYLDQTYLVQITCEIQS